MVWRSLVRLAHACRLTMDRATTELVAAPAATGGSTWSGPFGADTEVARSGCYARVTGKRPSAAHDDRLPVEGVSWWDAVKFCDALSRADGLTPAYHLGDDSESVDWDVSGDGYRLPTESEWEHAGRAGSSGPRSGRLDEIAWYRGNSEERIRPVGGRQANAWGLYG